MSVKPGRKTALICIFYIFSILSLDQWTKHLVLLKLKVGESVPLIKNILHITFVRNTGAAFGLFKNSTGIFILVSLIAVVVIGLLIATSIRQGEFRQNFRFNIGLITIFSGALGNLIDRLRFLYVIDFIDVRIWPVFNIADSSITIGTCLLLFSFFFQKRTP